MLGSVGCFVVDCRYVESDWWLRDFFFYLAWFEVGRGLCCLFLVGSSVAGLWFVGRGIVTGKQIGRAHV